MWYPRRLIYCVLLLVISFNTGRAQRMFGITTDDYNAYQSLFLNPANIADIHEKACFNVMSVAIGVDNNFGHLEKIGNITKSFSGDDSVAASSIFTNSGHKSFNMLVPVADIRGPGIVVARTLNQSFAITTRVRGFNQFNNFDQSLYNAVTTANYVAPNSYSISSAKFNWTAHMWSEIGLSYAAVLINEERSELKIGATVRRLGGIGYIAVKGNKLDLDYYGGSDSFYASHSDMHFSSNVISDSNAVLKGLTGANIFNKFFGGDAGSGFGGDFGISFRYFFGDPQPKDYVASNVTHDIVLSASVTDIGFITYKGTSDISIAGDGYLTGKGLSDNVKKYSTFKEYMKQQGFTTELGSGKTRVYMPTALLLSVDYQIYERFWANVNYVHNLANRQNFGNSYYDQVTLTPRFNGKIACIALPITYSALAHDFKVGVGFRVTGLFIGTDDMLALFSKKQNGFNCYMGVYIPAFKKAAKSNT